ncbi:MAG TPA: thiamine pyrophosphate-dependent enzyme [Elusimicrobiota bacterium]|jgi:pyruvate dehydrogenase (quinone)/pyruvate oxidase|nr:thiamine pyrophosphate-dependent enzyme [Elusimicrobiota bacterium]
MSETASDVLIESIMEWGVDVVFGLPGDGINGIMEALRKRRDRIRFVQVRHEEAAAFMACGYAKFTGRLGVCLATSGPGGIHLLNGLYDAKLDGAPVLAITGMQFHDLVSTHTQQDVELDKLFADVAAYNARIMGAAHVENAVELACRTALMTRGVAHVTIPVDVQEQPAKDGLRSKRNVAGHVSSVMAGCARLPARADLERAAALLNAGKKIAILAGQGALGASEELESLAEILGAPVIKALLGRACLPDDSPYTTGAVGLLGTRPSQEALEDCDTLLLIGTSFPYIEFYPKPGQARCVQLDVDPTRIGLRYPAEVALVGDAAPTLRLLLPLLRRAEDRSFLEKAQKGMGEWAELMELRAKRLDKPMKPELLALELGRRIPADAVVTCDSGTAATWWARYIPVKKGQKHALSGNLASMAMGLPYAIAAQIAFPERPVIAFVGDGAFSMLMAELATCVKYRLPVKVVILKNNTLGQIKWEQMVFLGNPEYGCELHPIDFAAFARACGATGFTIAEPAECGEILDRALETPGPVVVEALVDPLEPPLPPKIDLEQARHFAQSLARGEPNRLKIAMTVLEEKVREMT